MIKLMFALGLTMLSTSVLAATPCSPTNATACPQAAGTNTPGFCPSFKAVAQCHCAESGLPKGLCQDMNAIYKRMLLVFGSVQRACEYQHHTTTQTCLDDWNCYRTGGVNAQGELCSSTGQRCA